MKKIGIVICNYNKQDYIVNCVNSVMRSSISDFDIYVVDNASTDHSVKVLQEEFGEQITLLVNTENLGGSGGFNTGLREVLQRDYEYIMLMDNDIIVDEHAVEELLLFLQTHDDVGMVGSKVYYMDEPEKIWGYGGNIDFTNYCQKDCFKNMKDGSEIPEINYCDYVPACSLMVRTEAVRRVGIMPEDNFIYWDDMEWGYRFVKNGYKVAAYGRSIIWHKAGGRNATNTFIHYYMQRNRIHFFLNELREKEDRECFLQTILREYFRTIYSVRLKGEDNIAKTLTNAIVDAARGIRGKASAGKILPRPEVKSRLSDVLEGAKSVTIRFNGMYEGLGNIVKAIKNVNSQMKITIAGQDEKILKHQYPDCCIDSDYHPEKTDSHLIMCEHIFSLSSDMPLDTYIDSWCNVVYMKEDIEYARSYERTRELFVICMSALFNE